MNYAEGTFGYWWTVTCGNKDIAKKIYDGDIDARGSGITSCEGMPKEITCSLDLSGCTSLTTLPDNLSVIYSLYLRSCTSLTTLPDNLNVGGSLDFSGCIGLTTFSSNLTVYGSIYLIGCTGLTELPDNLSVGGWLDLYGCTSLTTLPDNLNVGGLLGLTGCTSLTTLPDNLKVGGNIYGDVYRWKDSTWSFFDGVQKEVKSVKKTKELTVYKMVDGTFCVYDGEHYSHGATLQEAKDDLIYKYSTRDLSKFESLKMDSVLTFAEAVELYRSVTGACSEGTRSFVESHGIDKSKSYTVAEIIERTNGQYNSQKLAEFFNK